MHGGGWAAACGAVCVNPVDTTGAGDAFIGSLACFLGSGCAEDEAVSRSNVYAALSTLAVGTQKSFANRERFEAAWNRAISMGRIL